MNLRYRWSVRKSVDTYGNPPTGGKVARQGQAKVAQFRALRIIEALKVPHQYNRMGKDNSSAHSKQET